MEEAPVIEWEGELWQLLSGGIVAITTNGFVTPQGLAVLGRGCAREARERFPDLPGILGELLSRRGNHVHYLGHGLVSFPVEESPFENPDLHLIRRSAAELVALADHHGWTRVAVPRPGCGGGGLSWRDVRPLLAPLFDDRFLIVAKPGEQG